MIIEFETPPKHTVEIPFTIIRNGETGAGESSVMPSPKIFHKNASNFRPVSSTYATPVGPGQASNPTGEPSPGVEGLERPTGVHHAGKAGITSLLGFPPPRSYTAATVHPAGLNPAPSLLQQFDALCHEIDVHVREDLHIIMLAWEWRKHKFWRRTKYGQGYRRQHVGTNTYWKRERGD